jgi:hypothetical protein
MGKTYPPAVAAVAPRSMPRSAAVLAIAVASATTSSFFSSSLWSDQQHIQK